MSLDDLKADGIVYIPIKDRVAFEQFAKQKGMPISVFEDEKKYGKNVKPLSPLDIGRKLAHQKKVMDNFIKMQEEYKRSLLQRKRQKLKEEMVEFGIKKARVELRGMLNKEHLKLDDEIYNAKRKYGAKSSAGIIRKAEQRTDDIISTGRYKARSVAQKAREMADRESILSIINYSKESILGLINSSKGDFNGVLADLRNGK